MGLDDMEYPIQDLQRLHYREWKMNILQSRVHMRTGNMERIVAAAWRVEVNGDKTKVAGGEQMKVEGVREQSRPGPVEAQGNSEFELSAGGELDACRAGLAKHCGAGID